MNQFTQLFNSLPPPNQQQFPGQPPQQQQQQQGGGGIGGAQGVDSLTQQLEYSFIDIPDLISLSEEEEVRPC